MKYPKDATRLNLIGDVPNDLDFFTTLATGEERLINASLVVDKLATLGLIKSSSDATLKKLTLTPDAVTGSATDPALSIAQIWNTTGAPSALLVDITDTASDAGSLLFDFKVGGVSKINGSKSGALSSLSILVGSGGFTTPSIKIGGTSTGFSSVDPLTRIDVIINGTQIATFGSTNTNVLSSYLNANAIGLDVYSGTPDTVLRRAAAATVQFGNNHATTATAQTLKAHDVTTGVGTDLNLAGGAGSSGKGRVRFMTAMGLPALTFAEASENPSQYNFVMITDSADAPLVDSTISSGGGGIHGCLCVVNANGEFVMISGTDFNFVPS